MVRAVKALIALVVAGMLALSGCSGQNPNHAAVVDGAVIPFHEVDALVPFVQGESATAATQLLVIARVGAAVARQQGAEFTEEERQGAAAGLPPELLTDPVLAGFATDYVTAVLVSQSLGQEFLQAASAIDVAVNPRLGSWDPETVSLMPGGSLSSPAPTS